MTKILIADDSWLSRRVLKKVLNDGSYETVEAVNGTEALAMLEEGEVACVFLDLVMPELDGHGVLRAVRERGISTPVVVVTADIQTTTRVRCEELGAVAVLNKPPKGSDVLEAVRQSLLRSQAGL